MDWAAAMRGGDDGTTAASGVVFWRVADLRMRATRAWGPAQVSTYRRGHGEAVWRNGWHRLTLALTDPGPVDVRVEDGTMRGRFGSGVVFLHPAGATTRAAHAASDFAQVLLDPALFRAAAADLDGGGRAFDPGIAPPFVDPLAVEILRALVREAEAGGPGDRLLVEGLSTALAVHLARRFGPAAGATEDGLPPTPRGSGGLSPRRLRRVLDYVEANLAGEITLADLAGVACLSPYHFSRCFKRATGEGAHRHVMRRRVERAKALLRDPDGPPLAEVAVASGFADQSHFTAAFRRETGTTPGRFRAEVAPSSSSPGRRGEP